MPITYQIATRVPGQPHRDYVRKLKVTEEDQAMIEYRATIATLEADPDTWEIELQGVITTTIERKTV